MSTMQQPDVAVVITPQAAVEVKKFMEAEGVTAEQGGLRVSVMPGGCSGFKYGLVIEDKSAEDDVIVDQDGFRVFVDPFSSQYLQGTVIDYVTSMQGLRFSHSRIRIRPAAAAAAVPSQHNALLRRIIRRDK